MDLRLFVRAARLPALAVLVVSLAACGDSEPSTPLAPDVPSAVEALDCGYIGSGGCAVAVEPPAQRPQAQDCGYIGSGGCRAQMLDVSDPKLLGEAKRRN